MKHLRHKKYAAVFNSTTLGVMQRMDLTGAELNLGTKPANRSLSYEAACKVGIRCSEAWWILSPLKIDEGGQGKTDVPILVCVYPSYNIHDDTKKAFGLLCSFTWDPNASRIGALISDHLPEGEKTLTKLLYSTSATYKDVYSYTKIEDTYITHHAYE